eukprot:CAMPEP_0202387802 /NCGR_PEP_ID=MMETSP1127-20130417/74016_1 /ASSEMBLY_ACC=CAM_ASM_000462 /TAXON_ID=3047 /ORGANISM="Dunaliella tertiolecta, Strain CCMP1320" /LENGTH=99 /DNA_ID=CAMNT_0048988961 /DNA_START=481 /DNA_END=777 /DNA_ORIENTATION=-
MPQHEVRRLHSLDALVLAQFPSCTHARGALHVLCAVQAAVFVCTYLALLRVALAHKWLPGAAALQHPLACTLARAPASTPTQALAAPAPSLQVVIALCP